MAAVNALLPQKSLPPPICKQPGKKTASEQFVQKTTGC